MTPGERARVKSRIVAAIANGSNVRQAALAQGISHGAFASWRRSDRVFDEQVSAAMRASGRADKADRPAPRSLTSPAVRAKKAHVLEALVDGATLAEAAQAAGTTNATVLNWRRVDAHFDRAVVRLWRAERPGHRPHPVAAKPLCRADDCEETRLHARGLCVRHYHQERRTGRLRPPDWEYGRTGCTVDGCGEPHRAHGLCARHYDAR